MVDVYEGFLKKRVISLRKGVIIAATLRARSPFRASNRIVSVNGSIMPNVLTAIKETTNPKAMIPVKNVTSRTMPFK